MINLYSICYTICQNLFRLLIGFRKAEKIIIIYWRRYNCVVELCWKSLPYMLVILLLVTHQISTNFITHIYVHIIYMFYD